MRNESNFHAARKCVFALFNPCQVQSTSTKAFNAPHVNVGGLDGKLITSINTSKV